jgi:uncharacterized YigZ family protein
MTTIEEDKFLTVPTQPVSSEIKIKGSKFIAHIVHVINRDQAESFYSKIRRKYHNASHNCFAYRISKDDFRYSDDGEPSGTAGKPLLRVLENHDLIQTIIVVTRYFGGTKLGTGGLSRAYSDAAKNVLNNITFEVKIRYATVTIEAGYDDLSNILDMVNKYKGVMGKTEYAEKINICIQIPATKFEDFKKEILAYSERGINIIDKDI